MTKRPLTDNEGEVRELTAEDFRRMRPVADVDPGMIEAMRHLRNRVGRPKLETPKVHIGFRLAAPVVAGIKATGRGYNSRVESVLREALAAGKLNTGRRSRIVKMTPARKSKRPAKLP